MIKGAVRSTCFLAISLARDVAEKFAKDGLERRRTRTDNGNVAFNEGWYPDVEQTPGFVGDWLEGLNKVIGSDASCDYNTRFVSESRKPTCLRTYNRPTPNTTIRPYFCRLLIFMRISSTVGKSTA